MTQKPRAQPKVRLTRPIYKHGDFCVEVTKLGENWEEVG